MAKKRFTQRHHIDYETRSDNNRIKQREWLVTIYAGEHQLISKIQKWKNCSTGFIAALRHEALRLEQNAVDLDKEYLDKVNLDKIKES